MSGPGPAHEELLASNLFGLDGRICLVTGGGTGIGLMLAQAMSINGAKVYITGRREETIKKSAELHSPKIGKGSIIPIVGDVSTKEGVMKLVDEFKKHESVLHTLCNNAGIAKDKETTLFSTNESLDFKSAESVSEHLLRSNFDNWSETFTTNVSAIYFTSAAFLPLLAKGNETHKGYNSGIVNITSISGIMKGPSSGQFSYSASKAAAIQVTRNLATTFYETKVSVNTIAPGIFPSEMTANSSDENNKSDISDKGKGLPAGRPGTDADMAAQILLLASRGGVFMNGTLLIPDGGALLTQPSSM